jgi:hypothetical protein
LWRGSDGLDARTGKNVVEGVGELSAAIAQQDWAVPRSVVTP